MTPFSALYAVPIFLESTGLGAGKGKTRKRLKKTEDLDRLPFREIESGTLSYKNDDLPAGITSIRIHRMR